MPKKPRRVHNRLCRAQSCALCAGTVPLAHFWNASTDHQLMVLHRRGIRTVADLRKKTRFEIERLRGFGPVGMRELVRIMDMLGLRFNPKGQLELKFK